MATKELKKIKYYGTGRRKTCVARVWIFKGSGKLIINGMDAKDYLHRDSLIREIKEPFNRTETGGQYDLVCTVKGGGKSGQAGAISHGISRALVTIGETFRPQLKPFGLLTRDSRMKERKKYGLKKARKASQYRKR
jgi:small subunit ribosomal protein S9